MTLELDLGSCNAKLARAREHLDALERETTAGIKKESPYAVRVSEVDPKTGWCSISIVPQEIAKPRLTIIFGDVIHNLRCALDYVVTALVDASQTQLTTSHQFPVFLNAADYATKVGTATNARSKGPLRGIIHGLTLIEKWQPYHTQPDPRTDPLWGIHRFSNADKHREPATFLAEPVGALEFDYKGTLVDLRGVPEITDWSPEQEYVIGHMRFDPPVARDIHAKGEMSLNVRFVTPPFGGDADLSITLSGLRCTSDHVAVMLDLFGKL